MEIRDSEQVLERKKAKPAVGTNSGVSIVSDKLMKDSYIAGRENARLVGDISPSFSDSERMAVAGVAGVTGNEDDQWKAQTVFALQRQFPNLSASYIWDNYDEIMKWKFGDSVPKGKSAPRAVLESFEIGGMDFALTKAYYDYMAYSLGLANADISQFPGMSQDEANAAKAAQIDEQRIKPAQERMAALQDSQERGIVTKSLEALGQTAIPSGTQAVGGAALGAGIVAATHGAALPAVATFLSTMGTVSAYSLPRNFYDQMHQTKTLEDGREVSVGNTPWESFWGSIPASAFEGASEAGFGAAGFMAQGMGGGLTDAIFKYGAKSALGKGAGTLATYAGGVAMNVAQDVEQEAVGMMMENLAEKRHGFKVSNTGAEMWNTLGETALQSLGASVWMELPVAVSAYRDFNTLDNVKKLAYLAGDKETFVHNPYVQAAKPDGFTRTTYEEWLRSVFDSRPQTADFTEVDIKTVREQLREKIGDAVDFGRDLAGKLFRKDKADDAGQSEAKAQATPKGTATASMGEDAEQVSFVGKQENLTKERTFDEKTEEDLINSVISKTENAGEAEAVQETVREIVKDETATEPAKAEPAQAEAVQEPGQDVVQAEPRVENAQAETSEPKVEPKVEEVKSEEVVVSEPAKAEPAKAEAEPEPTASVDKGKIADAIDDWIADEGLGKGNEIHGRMADDPKHNLAHRTTRDQTGEIDKFRAYFDDGDSKDKDLEKVWGIITYKKHPNGTIEIDPDGIQVNSDVAHRGDFGSTLKEMLTAVAMDNEGSDIYWKTDGYSIDALRKALYGKRKSLGYGAELKGNASMIATKAMLKAFPMMTTREAAVSGYVLRAVSRATGLDLSDIISAYHPYDGTAPEGLGKAETELFRKAAVRGLTIRKSDAQEVVNRIGAIVWATRKGDFSTFVHESEHLAQKLGIVNLTDKNKAMVLDARSGDLAAWMDANRQLFGFTEQGALGKLGLKDGNAVADYIEAFFKDDINRAWDEAIDEIDALAAEAYAANRYNSELSAKEKSRYGDMLEKQKKFMGEIYRTLRDVKVEVPENIRTVFDQYLMDTMPEGGVSIFGDLDVSDEEAVNNFLYSQMKAREKRLAEKLEATRKKAKATKEGKGDGSSADGAKTSVGASEAAKGETTGSDTAKKPEGQKEAEEKKPRKIVPQAERLAAIREQSKAKAKERIAGEKKRAKAEEAKKKAKGKAEGKSVSFQTLVELVEENKAPAEMAGVQDALADEGIWKGDAYGLRFQPGVDNPADSPETAKVIKDNPTTPKRKRKGKKGGDVYAVETKGKTVEIESATPEEAVETIKVLDKENRRIQQEAEAKKLPDDEVKGEFEKKVDALSKALEEADAEKKAVDAKAEEEAKTGQQENAGEATRVLEEEPAVSDKLDEVKKAGEEARADSDATDKSLAEAVAELKEETGEEVSVEKVKAEAEKKAKWMPADHKSELKALFDKVKTYSAVLGENVNMLSFGKERDQGRKLKKGFNDLTKETKGVTRGMKLDITKLVNAKKAADKSIESVKRRLDERRAKVAELNETIKEKNRKKLEIQKKLTEAKHEAEKVEGLQSRLENRREKVAELNETIKGKNKAKLEVSKALTEQKHVTDKVEKKYRKRLRETLSELIGLYAEKFQCDKDIERLERKVDKVSELLVKEKERRDEIIKHKLEIGYGKHHREGVRDTVAAYRKKKALKDVLTYDSSKDNIFWGYRQIFEQIKKYLDMGSIMSESETAASTIAGQKRKVSYEEWDAETRARKMGEYLNKKVPLFDGWGAYMRDSDGKVEMVSLDGLIRRIVVGRAGALDEQMRTELYNSYRKALMVPVSSWTSDDAMAVSRVMGMVLSEGRRIRRWMVSEQRRMNLDIAQDLEMEQRRMRGQLRESAAGDAEDAKRKRSLSSNIEKMSQSFQNIFTVVDKLEADPKGVLHGMLRKHNEQTGVQARLNNKRLGGLRNIVSGLDEFGRKTDKTKATMLKPYEIYESLHVQYGDDGNILHRHTEGGGEIFTDGINLTRSQLMGVYLAGKTNNPKVIDAIKYGMLMTFEEKQAVGTRGDDGGAMRFIWTEDERKANYASRLTGEGDAIAKPESQIEFELVADARWNSVFEYAEKVVEGDARLKRVVEYIGNDFKEYFPMVNEVTRKVFNIDMFEEDGYFPLQRLFTSDSGDMSESLLQQLNDPAYMSRLSGVERGFTIDKVDIGELSQTPVNIDLLGLFARHVMDTDHLVAFADWSATYRGLFEGAGSEELRSTFNKYFGDNAYKYLKDWVGEVVNPASASALRPYDQVISVLRGRYPAAVLGFSTSSIVTQALTSWEGFMPMLGKEGVKDYFRNLFTMKQKRFRLPLLDADGNQVTNADGAVYRMVDGMEYVRYLSSAMEARDMNLDVAAGKALRERRLYFGEKADGTMGKIADTIDNVQEASMLGLEAIDHLEVYAGWLTLYEQKMAELEKGTSFGYALRQEMAIQYADLETARTQPSGNKAYTAPFYKKFGNIGQILTMFTSALNVVYNNMLQANAGILNSFRKVGGGFVNPFKGIQAGEAFVLSDGERKAVLKKAVSFYAWTALTGLLVGLVKEGFDEDDEPEDVAKKTGYWMLSQGVETMPLFGDTFSDWLYSAMTGASWNTYNAMKVEAFRGPSDIISGLSKMTSRKKGAKLTTSGAYEFMQGIGTMLGLPTNETKKVVDFATGNGGTLYDLLTGHSSGNSAFGARQSK